ncbi:MAG TPA: cupredoxin domain-containing protein [Candidatus Dormibacteraeota bacterium]|jgi:plastocyanin
MTRCGLVAGSGAAALLAACGGSASPPSAATSSSSSMSMSSSTGMGMSVNATCMPSGTTLTLIAQNTMFTTNCLAAPAGQAVTVHFDNRDPLPHNLAIFSADPDVDKNAKELFKGDIVPGPKTVDYAVPAQPAGTYHFHCAVHPTQMFGSYVVK